MKIIKIEQYEEFKKAFEFNMVEEIQLLKETQFKTFNSELQEIVRNSLSHMTDSRRPKRHIETTIIISYIKYLSNFLIEDVGNFDKLYSYIVEDPSQYIGVEYLRDINNKNRRFQLY